ncbi:MAG TPA: hypothetical protein VGR53_11440 [Nitrososphaerales archaeon]|nr:hypothetical protein [Nitrososphaerales archaeon]
MSPEGKVQVMVRSSKVPYRTLEVSERIFSASGFPMGVRRSRVVLYDSTLTDEHLRAIKEGQKLSCSLGLKLEIIDLSRSNFARRLLSVFGRSAFGQPNLVVTLYSHQSSGDLSRDISRAR